MLIEIQDDNPATKALDSRICYVVQVIAFIISVASLVIIITVGYVGTVGGTGI